MHEQTREKLNNQWKQFFVTQESDQSFDFSKM